MCIHLVLLVYPLKTLLGTSRLRVKVRINFDYRWIKKLYSQNLKRLVFFF